MASQEIMQDDDEGQEITTGALVAINSAEINQQIMTAKAYPRDITTFRKKVLTFASMDEQVAQSCMYALKRKNADGSEKLIEGPSARFAEIVAQTWGNCRAGARVVEIGETHITAQGFFYDLENNVAVSFEVMRPIVGKKTSQDPNGRRFSNDMISVTGNAACSIALRNAVFKGVPKAYWNHGYMAARATVAGDMATISERRTKMLKAFKEDFKIDPEQVYALIGVKGAPDISLDHMVFLGGLHNAIKEGETTAERAFHPDNFPDGTMTPKQPLRSEFTQDKPAQSKPVDEVVQNHEEQDENRRTVDKPAGEQKSETVSGQETQSSAASATDRQAALDAQLDAWYGEMKAELAAIGGHPAPGEKLTGIRELTDLYDRVAPQLTGARLAEWQKLRETKQTEVLESTRKKK